jgi:uroporphyrinogen-III decarboxylase
LLWGSGLFVALIETPDLVTQLLELVTETYVQFMRAWTRLVPFEGDYAVHWSLLHKGHIMLRDDSAMNLSPGMFAEFIAPYNQRLLDTFGGGAEHFCGRGEHFISRMCGLRDMHAVAMSQPDWNDMETIYRQTVDRGIKLIGLARTAADQALARGRDLHGQVHCW